MPISRRQMLFGAAAGFGGVALCAELARRRQQEVARESPRLPRVAPSQAKSVIFLYMEGGPSHVDTFDFKPRLAAENGQPIKMEVPFRMGKERVLKSPFRFARHGESGLEISELFPHLAGCADELCLVRSMVAEHPDHGNGNYFMNTGSSLRGRPSIGSWFSYGLGSDDQELPAYVVMNERDQLVGGLDVLGCGFLPVKHSPTRMSSGDEPIPNLRRREPVGALQERKLAAIRRLNEQSIEVDGGAQQIESIIQNYELAFRMQTSMVDAADVSQETHATRKLYGLDDPQTALYGTSCLRARRLVERGVRFIQVVSPAVKFTGSMIRWDQHIELVVGHRTNARLVDQPIAGLITDLRARGLLDQTLIVWGAEFGRTPTSQTLFETSKVGRDHNPWGFTMWLCGGGAKGGMSYGATDEYGFRAQENPVSVHDLHATILHLCGIDHTQLTYRYGGRDFRLTDVYGNVVSDLIA